MGAKGKGPIRRPSKPGLLGVPCASVWEKGRWEVDEEDSEDKKLWPGVLLQSCREDVETALIMQYAHCRQIGRRPRAFIFLNL